MPASPHYRRRVAPGIALLLAVCFLGLMAILGGAFLTLARLERNTAVQRVKASKAYLLARSGLEDAVARLSTGQDPVYGGEDWDASGTLDPNEQAQEVENLSTLDVDACPAGHAMRPSFFVKDAAGMPALQPVSGRDRGQSGTSGFGTYALRIADLNARVHINGGDLSPTGCADLAPGGPNGFLLRLLDNLDRVLTGTSLPSLGSEVVGQRPPGGYRSVDDLKPLLGGGRFAQFSRHLTALAWVDPKVVKPQPVPGRPRRWQGIDDIHRLGQGATAGDGTPAAPWTRIMPSGGSILDPTPYAVRWEREFIYAASQLRLGDVVLEPRAPIAVNTASEAVLAAAFTGLSGTVMEVWDGNAGYDGGFSFFNNVANGAVDPPWVMPVSKWPYPNGDKTEDTPWIRTRAMYGSGYGSPSRPWYGPRNYNPVANHGVGHGGSPLPCPCPLGRLAETPALTPGQALGIARALRDRIAQAGPLQTWEDFNRFVDALPAWEDLNDDGILDGPPYRVDGWLGQYTRRIYQREDLDSDDVMRREVFQVASGHWAGGLTWLDPHLKRSNLSPQMAAGLTFAQKDVLKAMANPNTDLNDFNPDENLFKEADKTDVATLGIQPWVHTTELTLDPMGCFEIQSAGRLLDLGGRLGAQRQLQARARIFEVFRDTTQEDFLRPGHQILGTAAPYPLSGGQALVSYPESGGQPAATYDGQIGLGFIAPEAGPDETLRGALFHTRDATDSADLHVPDVDGPHHDRLIGTGHPCGHVFPDGVYSERDASLKFPMAGNLTEIPVGYLPAVPDAYVFYAAFWVKTLWLPEASPRAHALFSMSPAVTPSVQHNSMDIPAYWTPLSNILARPVGLYFVPARNNVWQNVKTGAYDHNVWCARGRGWSARTLLWGTTHSLYDSDTLHRRGLGGPPLTTRPVGRLQGHRWQHITLVGKAPYQMFPGPVNAVLLGRVPAASVPVGIRNGFGGGYSRKALVMDHLGDPADPNHLRFGEVAAAHNMNYVADATFANVRVGGRLVPNTPPDGAARVSAYVGHFSGASSPAALGRYNKESGAAYVSPPLPSGVRFLRMSWTSILPELWFDRDGDGWLGDASDGHLPVNDRYRPDPAHPSQGAPGSNGLRDVRIDLELWDAQRRASFNDPGGANTLPGLSGTLHYRARFVNEWDAHTRLNHPLDVTPFLDDVTLTYQRHGSLPILEWE